MSSGPIFFWTKVSFFFKKINRKFAAVKKKQKTKQNKKNKQKKQKQTNKQTSPDCFHVSDKLVIARLSCTVWPIFSSSLIFCFYFTRPKAREISQQNMRNSQNVGHIVLRTVR